MQVYSERAELEARINRAQRALQMSREGCCPEMVRSDEAELTAAMQALASWHRDIADKVRDQLANDPHCYD